MMAIVWLLQHFYLCNHTIIHTFYIFLIIPVLVISGLGHVQEADKAPVEVICVLKMLVEDGELVLYDGRRLLSPTRLQAEGFALPQEMQAAVLDAQGGQHKQGGAPCPPEIIPVHPDFRLIVLANRPGFPFHGNNLFRECGDIFCVHVVENLDVESEVALLRAYAPGQTSWNLS